MRFLLIFAILVLIGVAAAHESWIVRMDGVGPVKVGMTLSQLNAALHEHFSYTEEEGGPSCFYVRPKKHPQLAFMMEDGHLVRVDVDKAGIRTESGLGVGDTETRAKAVYGTKLRIEASQYTGDEGGHYLTVRSGNYGIRFETEHGKITEFYAGTYDAIQYVEGCE